MATDHDIVLAPAQTDCSFALVVQTRLLSRLYWSQAVCRIGAIDDLLLDGILDFVWEEHRGDIEGLRGLPVPDALTATHRSFEQRELSALRQLAAEADPSQGSGRESLCFIDVASFPQLLAGSCFPIAGLIHAFPTDSRPVHYCRSSQLHDTQPPPHSEQYPAWGPGSHEVLEAVGCLAAAASRELLSPDTTVITVSPTSLTLPLRLRCSVGAISQLRPDQPVHVLTGVNAWPSDKPIGRLTGDTTFLKGEHIVFVKTAVTR